jgi:peptidoglycan-associated lipoprotein
MLKKLVSVTAMTFALVACDKCGDEAKPMNEYTMQGNFEPGSSEDFKHNAGDTVYFATNSSHLSNDAKAALAKQIEWLKKYPSRVFTIEGNCDERGTSELNLALGERRASSVAKHMAAQGIDAKRSNEVSFGKERPTAQGHDEAAWAQNRNARTVIN